MTSPTIRPATADDLADLVRVAQEGDAHDTDVAYLAYVATTGAVLVAVDRDDRAIGFGGVVDVPTPDGAAAMVTDLFVTPAARGAGIGSALLTDLLDGRPLRMTCSSAHPAALPAYRAAGMEPVGRLRYLERPGVSAAVPRLGSLDECPALIDGDWEGERRSVVEHYRSRGALVGRHVVVDERDAGGAGAAVVVRRLHAASADEAERSMATLLAHVPAGALVAACVPEWQPLAARLVADGFVEVDGDTVCTTPGLRLDPSLVVVDPGLW